jgi:glycosyltransferase involved in cell wall biosynthesis
MRTADLLVSPAHYEPFSLVLLEAMACGTPVVTTANVGAADLVTPDCGLIVLDPGDAAALAAALRDLAGDAGRRAAMGRAARVAAERWGWPQVADRYLRLYEDVALQNGTVPPVTQNVHA